MQGNLILASQSPRRRELMRLISADFIVRPSDFDESAVAESDPITLVRRLARGKAAAVEHAPEDIVIGCDTVVTLDGKIFGKPHSREDARRMMETLSGRTHSVITGVCVLLGDSVRQFECETRVTFYPLTVGEIESYISTDEPYDKAGGYGIQERGGLFVERIEGDYSNVVGLPVAGLYRLLRSIGVTVL